MKFEIQIVCPSCAQSHFASAYAEEPIVSPTCPKCGNLSHAVDPLTVSIGAERALCRSHAELQSGDFSISIICSAIAVECYLTSAFLKWKALARFASVGAFPRDAETKAWEREFPRSGGFPKPADFVSKALVGREFDAFTATDPIAITVMDGFPDFDGISPKEYFQNTLFHRRNRIMHWGALNYERTDAEICCRAAGAILRVFATMDKVRAEAADKAMRYSLA